MAFSSTVAYKGVMGNARVAVLSCIADAASGNVSGGGIGNIFCAGLDPISMATASPRVKVNQLEAGTSAAGSVGIVGVATGDVFYLTIFGRS